MSIAPEILELLELIGTSEARKKSFILDKLHKPGASRNDLKKLIEVAVKEGLAVSVNNKLMLTDKGRKEVQKHRECYIHDKYVHEPRFLARFGRILEGRISDWHGHWRHRHGFDNNSLKQLYTGIHSFEGHVEDARTLADLQQGEKAAVAFAAGGYGLIRRLAEMGLTPGTKVQVIRCAPFFGPIEVIVRGVSLVLGRGVASKVLVKPIAGED